MRINDDRIAKRVFIARPEGKRGIGSVDRESEALGGRNWRRLSLSKEE